MIGPFDYPGCVPPEHEQGEPTEHVCAFCDERMAIEDHETHECKSVICSECRTTTLEDFVTDGRCEECAAPIEEVPVLLMERLKLAHQKALAARDMLLAAKIVQWVGQVERVENGLRELEGRS